MAVDGTVFDLPGGAANEAAYAVPAGGSRPQARLVALAECGTLALAGAAFDSIEVGECALFECLSDRLRPDMLLLADRGFPPPTTCTRPWPAAVSCCGGSPPPSPCR